MIDSRGLVHRFRHVYRSEIEPISVEVELRYDRGEFVVEPPPWLEEARRATERPAAPSRRNRSTTGDLLSASRTAPTGDPDARFEREPGIGPHRPADRRRGYTD